MLTADEAGRVTRKFPDRVVTVFLRTANAPELRKHKFVVPKDLIMRDLVRMLKRKPGTEKQALFFFCNNGVVHMDSTFAEIRARHACADGIVYIKYAVENTFGCPPSKKNG